MNIPFPQTPHPSSPAQPESETSHPVTEYAATTPQLVSFLLFPLQYLYGRTILFWGCWVMMGWEEAKERKKKEVEKLMRTTDQRMR
jgi:hypothetical protein